VASAVLTRGPQKPHDIVIVVAPAGGLGGLAVAQQLRDGEHQAMVPLVLVTPTPVDERSAARTGIAAQLLTPVRSAQLHAALARLTGVAVTDAKSPPTDRPHQLTVPASRAGAGRRVLVAEDNAINSLVTVRVLEELGYVTETVEDGRQAVEAAARSDYDVILMDCHMPQMDGFAATAAIRQQERTAGQGRHIPIIALTADALAGDAARCRAAGMDDYLAKPVPAERIAAMLERWIGEGEPPVEDPSVAPDVLAELRVAGLLDAAATLYLREAPGQMEALRRAAARGEAATVAEVAHQLKGSSGQVGARALAALAARLQEQEEREALEGTAPVINALEQEFTRVRTLLEEACGEVAPS
jgi:CheY-like chemotaxis protein